ncbi:MAG: chromosomal replication initiator protein DnaA [Muribaculaceae bacterium]
MDKNHQQLWDECRQFIKDNISPKQYDVWFRDITSISFENKDLKLMVPSSFFVEQLEERFLDVLRAAIRKVYGDGVRLYYNYNQVQGEPSTTVNVRSASPSAVIGQGVKAQPANPFKQQPAADFDSQLNPRYTFQNYCAGRSNEIARSIGQSIADNPSLKTFNPLFVFGPTGVGKTHLIQAVGIGVKEKTPSARVLYVTARLFESQFTAAQRKGDINNFFHFYQSIDTLIIDDIQDINNKPATQNTFFHIFNHLHQNNKQIILSSDCAPAEMEGFEGRLLSRFKWGISTKLDKPDAELRRQVLIQKAEQDGLSLPADVIDFIAENVTDSIREIEGVAASLIAHATVLNCDITVDLARRVIANAVKIRSRQINFDMVAEAVGEYYGLDVDLIFTKSRKREISDARQVVMYLSKKLAKMPTTTIGVRLGRTHATVIYACRNIEERMPLERKLYDDIHAIEKALSK